MDKIILTDNGKRVLAFMQEKNETLIGKQIGIETNIKGIYLVLNSLIKRGLVENDAAVVQDFTNNKGETRPKEYQTYRLTDFGRAFIID